MEGKAIEILDLYVRTDKISKRHSEAVLTTRWPRLEAGLPLGQVG